jgi:hypothetical protein
MPMSDRCHLLVALARGRLDVQVGGGSVHRSRAASTASRRSRLLGRN